ncbi:MAG TPA: hypothetical protein VFJ64_00795 [Solirubrobacterales bacterium]|nr:hypothetical protein [Solirubrobacterales bacterium]
MRRNVFISEFILPLIVGTAMLFPILVIERKLFGWSKEAGGITEIIGIGLFVLIWPTLGPWLAPKIRLPAPTMVTGHRSDLHR